MQTNVPKNTGPPNRHPIKSAVNSSAVLTLRTDQPSFLPSARKSAVLRAGTAAPGATYMAGIQSPSYQCRYTTSSFGPTLAQKRVLSREKRKNRCKGQCNTMMLHRILAPSAALRSRHRGPKIFIATVGARLETSTVEGGGQLTYNFIHGLTSQMCHQSLPRKQIADARG